MTQADGTLTQTESAKRTHDFEPFFRAFAEALHEEGHLLPTLGLGEPAGAEANASRTHKE